MMCSIHGVFGTNGCFSCNKDSHFSAFFAKINRQHLSVVKVHQNSSKQFNFKVCVVFMCKVHNSGKMSDENTDVFIYFSLVFDAKAFVSKRQMLLVHCEKILYQRCFMIILQKRYCCITCIEITDKMNKLVLKCLMFFKVSHVI